ncbi:MAG: hypothetical protein V3R51_05105 [Gammaproteobacteria bacterium]
MAKKIAVLIRDRTSEALRMALGLTLVDDVIDVFVLDRTLSLTEEDRDNVTLMKELNVRFYSNQKDNNDMEILSDKEIATKLLGYDNVLPY